MNIIKIILLIKKLVTIIKDKKEKQIPVKLIAEITIRSALLFVDSSNVLEWLFEKVKWVLRLYI